MGFGSVSLGFIVKYSTANDDDKDNGPCGFNWVNVRHTSTM